MPRPKTRTRIRAEFNQIRRRLEKDLRCGGIAFKITKNPGTAIRAKRNEADRTNEEKPPAAIEELIKSGIAATVCEIRGRGRLVYVPKGMKRETFAHEMAHVAHDKLARRISGKRLSLEIDEGLAFSFEMDYMSSGKIADMLTETGMEFYLFTLVGKAHPDTIKSYEKGFELARTIYKLAPGKENKQRRAHMRKNVIREGFQTTAEAIAYLKKNYSEKR